jgi:hypothetical protein
MSLRDIISLTRIHEEPGSVPAVPGLFVCVLVEIKAEPDVSPLEWFTTIFPNILPDSRSTVIPLTDFDVGPKKMKRNVLTLA